MIGDPVNMDLNEALFYMIEAHTYAVQNIAKKDPKSDEYTNAIRGAMAFEIAIEGYHTGWMRAAKFYTKKYNPDEVEENAESAEMSNRSE